MTDDDIPMPPTNGEQPWRSLVRAAERDLGAAADILGRDILERGRAEARRRLDEQAQDFARAARRESTIAAYEGDVADFAAWCADFGYRELPADPATLGRYLADLAETRKLALATLQRRLSAIAAAHRLAGMPIDRKHPAIAEVMKGIARRRRAEPAVKQALLTEDVGLMVRCLPGPEAARLDPKGVLAARRDRALLLIGYAGALRRSELVGLDAARPLSRQADPRCRGWIEALPDRLILHLWHTKGDRAGEGQRVALPAGDHAETCPVKAWHAWREAAGLETGPAFRRITRTGAVLATRLSDQMVALIVKRLAPAAGLDPKGFAAHSLRRGHITMGFLADVPEADLQAQARHASAHQTRRYRDEARLLAKSSGGRIGL